MKGFYIVLGIMLALSFAMFTPMIDESSATADIEISDVCFDEEQCTLSFTGTSVYELVNVRVLSDRYTSPITACIVESNVFSDSIYLGDLESGIYHLEVSHGTIRVTNDFFVGSQEIEILDASYDMQTGMFHISGTSLSPLVNVRVYSGSYTSDIDACVVENGTFEDRIYLGLLNTGRYLVEVTDYSGRVLKYLDVEEGQGGDPYANLSTYSDDGKTLIEYHGTVSRYTLPTFIECIADNAFDNASIETFVLTKDVVWEIELEQNKFPFQNASLKNIIIEDGVTEIPDYIFAHTIIEHLVIPSSVERIGIKAFYFCNNLKDVTFEDDSRITNVDQYAFSCNPSLSLVTFNGSREGYTCYL